MADKNTYAELSDGTKMPLMGYGTFLSTEEDKLIENIVHAVVDVGYRHIDTASLYMNEEIIGKALAQCFEKGINREDLFITTKVWRTDFGDVEGSIKGSLEKLGLEYVDLLLIHWTVTDVDWETYEIKGPSMYETWKQFEKVKEDGLTKSIGVSNANNMIFVDICAGATHRPVVNQIETNPFFAQQKVVDFQGKFGTKITAYAPIGAAGFTASDLLKDETLAEIATKHNATVAQVALAWNMKRGVIVIPKSMTKERIQENFDALNVDLDEEDMEKINALDKNQRCFNPEDWDYPQYGWQKNPVWD
ncbi:unnamed protein product [Moneuplotes crassus]|uniref:NADP-dependent oxidoreductase domain-containing protein n=2 Tax=Euplotes crassus TaxID=5936 RepID=A0AAD1XP30_EUPCR|nr:unnamed protein product [Moneuplotes crassus]